MSSPFVTVEQAAEELKLHAKTVLRYIHDGRLAATRIGKAYRVTRADLDSFSGIARGMADAQIMARATCIIDVPQMDVEQAERLATFVQSAAMTGSAETPMLSAQTAYDANKRNMKLVLIGIPGDISRLLGLVDLHLGNRR